MNDHRLYVTPRILHRWHWRKFAENVAVAAGTAFVGLVIGAMLVGWFCGEALR
jgi:hypothetical protein